MKDHTLTIRALEVIQGSLRAAADDCHGEEKALRDGDTIDDGMLDGALFHAKEGVARLEKLIAAVRSEDAPATDAPDTAQEAVAPSLPVDDLHALLADVLYGLNMTPNTGFIDRNGERSNTYALAARIDRIRKP